MKKKMQPTVTFFFAILGVCVDGAYFLAFNQASALANKSNDGAELSTSVDDERSDWGYDQWSAGPMSKVTHFVEPRGQCPISGQPHSIRNDLYGPAVRVCPLSSARQGKCKVLSFGIDYNFDVDNYFLNDMGCEVWSFDPSMKKDPSGKDYKQGPNHRFFYQGIGDHDGDHKGKSTVPLWAGGKQHYDVRSLPSIMAEMGVDFVDVVRMDTEGAEFEVIKSWQQAGLLPKIGQLLMEVHGMDKKGDVDFRSFTGIKCDVTENDQKQCFDALPYSEENTHDINHGTWEVTLTHSKEDKQKEMGQTGGILLEKRPGHLLLHRTSRKQQH